jgi:predicted nucleic acid-binding protein
MKLVDTSSWVEYLRDRESEAGDSVEVLVLSGEAAWCDITLVELWHGVRGAKEKRELGGNGEGDRAHSRGRGGLAPCFKTRFVLPGKGIDRSHQ